jgi:hypothetical protein
MTKRDKISYLLMAPLVLTMIGFCVYAIALVATTAQPLGFVAVAIIVAFIIGAARFIDIEND